MLHDTTGRPSAALRLAVLLIVSHFVLAVMDAKTCFQSMYADFLTLLNPADIAGELYAKGLLTQDELDHVDNTEKTVRERTTVMLKAVGRGIDNENYSQFLDILDSVAKYRGIVKRARGKSLRPVCTSIIFIFASMKIFMHFQTVSMKEVSAFIW